MKSTRRVKCKNLNSQKETQTHIRKTPTHPMTNNIAYTNTIAALKLLDQHPQLIRDVVDYMAPMIYDAFRSKYASVIQTWWKERRAHLKKNYRKCEMCLTYHSQIYQAKFCSCDWEYCGCDRYVCYDCLYDY